MEVALVAKKRRLLNKHQKDYCKGKQRSHDAAKPYKSLDQSSLSNDSAKG